MKVKVFAEIQDSKFESILNSWLTKELKLIRINFKAFSYFGRASELFFNNIKEVPLGMQYTFARFYIAIGRNNISTKKFTDFKGKYLKAIDLIYLQYYYYRNNKILPINSKYDKNEQFKNHFSINIEIESFSCYVSNVATAINAFYFLKKLPILKIKNIVPDKKLLAYLLRDDLFSFLDALDYSIYSYCFYKNPIIKALEKKTEFRHY